MKTIGIIGGMGPLATADLYKKIIFKTKAEKDQEHVHVIIDGNTNIPDRTTNIIGEGENPIIEMVKSGRKLQNAGADFLIMPCNTAHYFYDEIIKNVNIPMLNMLDETVKRISKTYGNEVVVGLLATDGTSESGIYDNYFERADIKLIKPQENQKYVMEFIYEGIKKGNYDIGTDGFFKAVDELKEKGADVFILGCTELSSAADIYKFEGNFIDPMDILAERAIEYAGGLLNETKTN